ncbi:MAG: nucleotidyltransferase domain-containing protein [Desulfobacterota bacterium]|nr:nucleotidyltransferase domain-containing protein [Thermodesulfobacteriota bacterium]
MAITSLKTDEKHPVLQEIKKALTSFLDKRLVKLVLFGSRARGDYSAGSDFDIAIIVQGLTPQLKKEIYNAIADVELAHDTPVSAIALSEEEFEHLKQRERAIALDIEREGIPL